MSQKIFYSFVPLYGLLSLYNACQFKSNAELSRLSILLFLTQEAKTTGVLFRATKLLPLSPRLCFQYLTLYVPTKRSQ